MSITLTGACHCRSVRVRFRLSMPPSDLVVTTCKCGFCRRHGARMTADPAGKLEIRADLGAMLRYKFETKSADYILCSRCATYVAQVSAPPGGPRHALVNVNCLDDQEAFQQTAIVIEPLIETVSQRREQRARTWTPCTYSS